MKKLALPLLALSVVIAGCGSESLETHVNVPAPRAPTPTPTPTAEVTIYEVGEPATQGGVQLTVNSAENSPTISLNESGYRAGSGFETYTDVPAQAGGHYVYISTTVKNVGKESMDLTCGWPVELALYDASERAFDPIDSLHHMRDNPECNAKLQPGFESPMSYGFLVPDDAEVLALAFRDTTTAYGSDSAFVRLVLP